jgi:hypothetical protein
LAAPIPENRLTLPSTKPLKNRPLPAQNVSRFRPAEIGVQTERARATLGQHIDLLNAASEIKQRGLSNNLLLDSPLQSRPSAGPNRSLTLADCYAYRIGSGRLFRLPAGRQAENLTAVAAENQTTRIPLDESAESRESPTSLLPEGILEQLTPQELRDLIAYLQSPSPETGE